MRDFIIVLGIIYLAVNLVAALLTYETNIESIRKPKLVKDYLGMLLLFPYFILMQILITLERGFSSKNGKFQKFLNTEVKFRKRG